MIQRIIQVWFGDTRDRSKDQTVPEHTRDPRGLPPHLGNRCWQCGMPTAVQQGILYMHVAGSLKPVTVRKLHCFWTVKWQGLRVRCTAVRKEDITCCWGPVLSTALGSGRRQRLRPISKPPPAPCDTPIAHTLQICTSHSICTTTCTSYTASSPEHYAGPFLEPRHRNRNRYTHMWCQRTQHRQLDFWPTTANGNAV